MIARSTLVALLVASSAIAQPFDAPPPPGAPRPLVIDAPEVATLDNGRGIL